MSPKKALKSLKDYPYQDLGFAKVDHHREVVKGYPEIVYGLGKTPDQIVRISREIIKCGSNLLVTRIEPDVYARIKGRLRGTVYSPAARTVTLLQKPAPPGKGKIAVITAGTSDPRRPCGG